MPVDDANAHSASIAVHVAADVAYAFLADGLNQSYWALGSLERRALGDDLYLGTSMFDGKELYVRLGRMPISGSSTISSAPVPIPCSISWRAA